LFFVGVLVALIGFYWWQPWDFDLFPRSIPNPHPKVEPGLERLFSRGVKVTIVTAHPDDSEFFAGGLLHRLSLSGAQLSQIIVTDGDKAYYPFEDWQKNRRVRRQEALEAARAWNGADLVFLGFPDGRLQNSEQVRRAVLRELLRLKPEYILCFDPEFPPRLSHQDHRRAGEATQAVSKESGANWLLHFATSAPNWYEDVSRTWEKKMALVRIHKSQFFGSRLERIESMLEFWSRRAGLDAGVALAEPYRCVRLR